MSTDTTTRTSSVGWEHSLAGMAREMTAGQAPPVAQPPPPAEPIKVEGSLIDTLPPDEIGFTLKPEGVPVVFRNSTDIDIPLGELSDKQLRHLAARWIKSVVIRQGGSVFNAIKKLEQQCESGEVAALLRERRLAYLRRLSRARSALNAMPSMDIDKYKEITRAADELSREAYTFYENCSNRSGAFGFINQLAAYREQLQDIYNRTAPYLNIYDDLRQAAKTGGYLSRVKSVEGEKFTLTGVKFYHRNTIHLNGTPISLGTYSIVVLPGETPMVRLDHPTDFTKPHYEKFLAARRAAHSPVGAHPHLSGQDRMCYGDLNPTINTLSRAGQIVPVLELTKSALNNYVPSSAYYSLINAFGSAHVCKCPACKMEMVTGTGVTKSCEKCGKESKGCNGCVSARTTDRNCYTCKGKRCRYCPGFQCRNCGNQVCNTCGVKSKSTGSGGYPYCLTCVMLNSVAGHQWAQIYGPWYRLTPKGYESRVAWDFTTVATQHRDARNEAVLEARKLGVVFDQHKFTQGFIAEFILGLSTEEEAAAPEVPAVPNDPNVPGWRPVYQSDEDYENRDDHVVNREDEEEPPEDDIDVEDDDWVNEEDEEEDEDDDEDDDEDAFR